MALKRDGPRHQHDFPNHKLVQLSEEQKSKIEDEEHPEKRTTFNFGKYRGKSLTWVSKNHPSYLLWIYENRHNLFGKYRWLQPALLSEGIFPQEVLSLDSEADERAKKIISALNTVDPSSAAVPIFCLPAMGDVGRSSPRTVVSGSRWQGGWSRHQAT